MPFKKGEISNPGGRPKGGKNKATKLKEKLDGTMTLKDYNDIVDFKNDLIKLANELIAEANTFQERKAVFDSVSKYVFFEKQENKQTDSITVTIEGVE